MERLIKFAHKSRKQTGQSIEFTLVYMSREREYLNFY